MTVSQSVFHFLELTHIMFLFFRNAISVNKQINDKERIAAAMENPNLRDLVENCIKEEE